MSLVGVAQLWIVRPREYFMPKWSRILISGIIAFFIFAVTFPNLIRARDGGIGMIPFIYILCISIIPFLMISVFAGRMKPVEIFGWCVQLFFLVAVLVR
jgi:hypothetical protein